MTAYDKYKRFEQKLLQGRAEGTLEEAAEDALLDDADDLWWQMSEEERESVSQEARIRSQMAHKDNKETT